MDTPYYYQSKNWLSQPKKNAKKNNLFLAPANGPYLGIDHMNKSRGMRGGHTAEKAIVIHN